MGSCEPAGLDKMMDLSIIIVNWNTSELLLQCLKSIYNGSPNFTFEVILVDNGSTDDSVSQVEKHVPQVSLIKNNENVGFAKANNLGISKARGRYIMLLNSDTIVMPQALDALIEVADRCPEVGVLSPKLLNMDGTLQESWASFPTLWSELIGKNIRRRRSIKDFPSAFDVDWISGACMLVRSNAVGEVGMLDEDYFMYSEEADWCFRIKKMGWKIWYFPNAEIYHLGGGSANRTSLTQLVLLYRSKILFFRKHYGKLSSLILRYALAFANILGLLRRAFLLGTGDRKLSHERFAAQSQLIWFLLRDRASAIDV